MAAVGAAMLFVGVYLMYSAYEAIHNHAKAQPLTKATTALKG